MMELRDYVFAAAGGSVAPGSVKEVLLSGRDMRYISLDDGSCESAQLPPRALMSWTLATSCCR